MSEQQSFQNHRKWVPAYHYVLFPLDLAILIGAVINFFKSTGGPGLYSASLILAMAVVLIIVTLFARVFALRAQDRTIRLEENFRKYLRDGSLLDSRLTVRQIVGLRFATDEEFDDLAARAVSENLSEDDIKKAIKNWRADTDRV